MGADLFESYVGSIIATIALVAVGVLYLDANNPIGEIFGFNKLILLPILVLASGIFSSILGTFLVRTKEGATMSSLLWSLRYGIFGAGGLVLIATGLSVWTFDLSFNYFWVVLIGLVAGQIIGTSSEYYTSYEFKPTKDVAKQAETGPATVVIAGLGLGMISTLIPAVVVVIAMWGTYSLAGDYGVALAAIGMLSTLGITLATDAVSYNI